MNSAKSPPHTHTQIGRTKQIKIQIRPIKFWSNCALFRCFLLSHWLKFVIVLDWFDRLSNWTVFFKAEAVFFKADFFLHKSEAILIFSFYLSTNPTYINCDFSSCWYEYIFPPGMSKNCPMCPFGTTGAVCRSYANISMNIDMKLLRFPLSGRIFHVVVALHKYFFNVIYKWSAFLLSPLLFRSAPLSFRSVCCDLLCFRVNSHPSSVSIVPAEFFLGRQTRYAMSIECVTIDRGNPYTHNLFSSQVQNVIQ